MDMSERFASLPDSGRSMSLSFLEIDDESLLDRGIATIESILEPGSNSLSGLSEDQVKGLKELKGVLLGGLGEETYIPQSLLHNKNKEASKYLLTNFGGVKESSKKKFKTVMKANLFVNALQKKAASSRSISKLSIKLKVEKLFAPPQWLNVKEEEQARLREILSWDNLQKWDFPIFEVTELSNGHPLVLLGWAILASPHSQHVMDKTCGVNEHLGLIERPGYRFMEKFNIPHEALAEFLLLMENEYSAVTPYHNKTHASDVLQSLHVLLQLNGKAYATESLQVLAALVSAVVHDVGHPGVNNAYQVNAKTNLALVYNDISPLENMHMAKTFEVLMGQNKSEAYDIFKGLTREQHSAIRKLMIDAVLHTDMTKHFHTVSQIKGIQKIQGNASGDIPNVSMLNDDQKWLVMGFLLHIADISNPAKPFLFVKWADLCLEEFFLQGDHEKEQKLPISPLCDRDTTKRPDSQIGFIKFVIQPAFELVGKLLPRVDKEINPIIQSNLKYWVEEKAKTQHIQINDRISVKVGGVDTSIEEERQTADIGGDEELAVPTDKLSFLKGKLKGKAFSLAEKTRQSLEEQPGGKAREEDENSSIDTPIEEGRQTADLGGDKEIAVPTDKLSFFKGKLKGKASSLAEKTRQSLEEKAGRKIREEDENSEGEETDKSKGKDEADGKKNDVAQEEKQ